MPSATASAAFTSAICASNGRREQGLDGEAPPWDGSIPLLSIAGTKAIGVGNALHIFAADEPNDGTVAVSETELPQAAAFYRLPTSHSALQFDRKAVALADCWFRSLPLTDKNA